MHICVCICICVSILYAYACHIATCVHINIHKPPVKE